MSVDPHPHLRVCQLLRHHLLGLGSGILNPGSEPLVAEVSTDDLPVQRSAFQTHSNPAAQPATSFREAG